MREPFWVRNWFL